MLELDNQIKKVMADAKIPYLDVCCCKGNDQVYRFISDGATGKETLAMFSMSKPITSICAMTLIEEGKLSLDDLVEDYLPEIKKAFILKDGVKTPLKNKMTVRHLFTMTAGFNYRTLTPSIIKMKEQTNFTGDLRQFISAFVKEPLEFEPGDRFLYSLCLDVLACVVEVVAGKKFSQVVKERIFEPIEMNNSSFDNSITEFAPYYLADESGEIISSKVNMWPLLTPNYESGGAGLISTVEDYVKFAKMLANGGVGENGVRVIGEKALMEVASPQIDKVSVNNNFTCVQGQDYSYGLGMRVRKIDTDWGLPKGEFGWDGALGSYLLVDPKNNVSIVMGMHLGNWVKVFKTGHLQIVEQIYKELVSVISPS